MAMATFCCLQPSLTFSFQHQNRFFLINSNRKSSSFSTKIRGRRLTPSSKRFVHISPLNSASVNGYSIQSGSSNEVFEERDLKVIDHLRRLIDILPGGSWWRLSTDQVDVSPNAKPVTIFRALQRIWDLISDDRPVVFAAFAALLISSVSFFFFSLCKFLEVYCI